MWAAVAGALDANAQGLDPPPNHRGSRERAAIVYLERCRVETNWAQPYLVGSAGQFIAS